MSRRDFDKRAPAPTIKLTLQAVRRDRQDLHAARHYVYFALHGKVSPLPGAARAFQLQKVHFLTINAWAWFVEFGYAVALAAMLYSLAAAFAMRRPISPVDRSGDQLPPVTILKPLCGAEPDTYSCLRSFCL